MKKIIFFTAAIVFLMMLIQSRSRELRNNSSLISENTHLTASYTSTERSRWFLSPIDPPRFVILLIHGLNQKPSKWKDMITFLNTLPAHVYRLTLKGHRGGDFSEMMSVTSDAWENDFLQGYREMKNKFPDLKPILLGYSIGALVGLEYQQFIKKPLFDKQIFLAPAISTRFYVRLIDPFTSILSYLPSRSPRQYRANQKGTSMAAYQAFFDLYDRFHSAGTHQFVNIRTLVLTSPRDELIDFSGLKKVKEDYQLINWEILPIQPHESHLKVPYNHLIIDVDALGDAQWSALKGKIKQFIGADG